jgi:hypothetical protein
MRFTGISESDNVKDTCRRKLGQADPVENARTADHSYTRTVRRLWYLPVTDRVAAVETWTALHDFIRLGTEPRRVTDEDLLACAPLAGRSAEYAGKGLQVLVRLGLISRNTNGSRRELAIVGKLKGARADHIPEPGKKVASPPAPAENDVFIPLTRPFWELVSECQKTGT